MASIKDKLRSDFSDIENVISDTNHVVRKYYYMFLSGDYGEEIYNKYLNQWNYCKTERQLRSFVIRSFCDNQAIDYSCSDGHIQKSLMEIVGLDNLERLNLALIEDATNAYEEGKQWK